MPSESELNDNELGCRARSGSLSAFEELVRRYEVRIYSFAMVQVRSSPDAQEITQDVFVKAWQSFRTWDSTRPLTNWLFAIARNSCVDHRRKKSPLQEVLDPEQLTESTTPSDILARTEEAAELWVTAQRLLPERQFSAVWLRYGEEMKIEDIAPILGLSRANVKVLLFRARLTLSRHSSFKHDRTNVGSISAAEALQQTPVKVLKSI